MKLHRNVLTQKETFTLLKIVEAKYVESKLNDEDFADLVYKENPESFRSPLARGHIATCRETLGIPNNLKVGSAGKGKYDNTLGSRVACLEQEVTQLKADLTETKQRLQQLEQSFRLNNIKIIDHKTGAAR
jgi:hypothetical protein